jgi:hypothetical protein
LRGRVARLLKWAVVLSGGIVLAVFAASRLAESDGHPRLQVGEGQPSAAPPSAIDSPNATPSEVPVCSWPTTPKVWVRIFSPAPAATVESPVLFHLRTVRPAGCDATYLVAVDGIPYQFLGLSEGSQPGPRNPEPSRPLPRRDVKFACISTRDFYGSLDLPPGHHVLRVLYQCPQGTSVPRTVPAAVMFSVVDK